MSRYRQRLVIAGVDGGKRRSAGKCIIERAHREIERRKQAGREILRAEIEAKLKDDDKPSQPPQEAANLEPNELVKAVYLRTLSRLPNEAELETSTKHLAQAESPIAGARDLLWALINTKEFIVNH